MRSFLTVLLPAAATTLALTTVSTAVAPARVAEEPRAAQASAHGEVALRDTTASRRPPAAAPGPGPAAVAARGRWGWPLRPRPDVARPFQRPASTWGAGHRGVDLGAAAGGEVLAVDDGIVAHVGVVAGRGTVTVVHRSGLRSTYEPVHADVATGDLVRQGQHLGTLTTGGHCSPATCLHLGAVRGEAYLDPLTLLTGSRVRLLPLR